MNNAKQQPAPAIQPARNQWMLVAFAVFAAAWGGNEFTPMMVFYRGEEVFGAVFVESLLASYAVGIAAALLVSGTLSDRYGRKAVMLPAPVVALLGSLFIAAGETSEPLILIGRILSGISIGMVMSSGSAWIKELSTPEFEPTVKPGAGARRATMSMTLGFALGALTAGILAEWGPAPGQTPYIVHAVLSAISLAGILRVTETRRNDHLNVKGTFWSDVLVPTAKHPRFILAVLPTAPWVFGCAGVAYAIMPSLIQKDVSAPTAFTALVTALALIVGFTIQQFSARYTSPSDTRGQQLGLAVTFVGMILATVTAIRPSMAMVVVVAVVLGLGYGMCLISGLTELQRLATPDDLGGLTAIFYTVSYVGFFFPMILRALSNSLSYPQMLGFGAVMAALFFVVVRIVSRRFL